MNGIELYKHVPEIYRDWLMFFTGTIELECISYLNAHNIKLLRRPEDIVSLQRAIRQKLMESNVEITS